MPRDRAASRALNREILALAVPALGALVAEPLFLLTDTALVGHLGREPLAALGVASTILQTVIGLLIFLAYATTPAVARRLGAGDTPGALRAGVDGLWLALGISVVLVALAPLAIGPAVAAFGVEAEVAEQATTYLAISVIGLPAMLLVIAATGLFRGLQDTRTPLIVAVAGFAANAVLNVLFIYGLGLGLAGSAIGTVIAQWGMALVYLVIAVRATRRWSVALTPGLAGIGIAAQTGGWLFLRTVSLRIALLATVIVASGFGTAELAAYQVGWTIFATIAFVLDSLAIAGQAMVGFGIGARNADRVHRVTRRLVGWGIGFGALLTVVIAASAWVLPLVFSSDSEVRELIRISLLVMAVTLPVAGFVFVLDGVLIGGGDFRYLALTGILNLVVYLPFLVAIAAAGTGGAAGLALLWAAFGIVYLGARALTLGLRAYRPTWVSRAMEAPVASD
jgi:putative MATE family efflux protein